MKAQGILVEIIMSGIWKNIKNNEIKPSEWFIHVKKEDLSAKSQEILSIFDADKNGYIDKEEVASIFSSKQEYENLDKNSLFKFKSEVYSLIRNSNSSQIAQKFYDIADNNYGSNSMQKMKELLEGEITQYNILDILDAYDDESIRKGDSSIIDTIISEVGAGSVLSSKAFFNKSAEQKAVLTDILDKLCIAAYESGVSDEDIEYARNEFISSMNKELGAWQRKTNPKEMEKAIDFLRGAILSAQSSVQDISEVEARETLAKGFNQEYNAAQGQFNEAKNGVDTDGDGKNEGGWKWAAKTGDWVCGLFGCNTIKDLEKKLGANAKYAEMLLEAAENGEAIDKTTGEKLSFNDVYKKVTGGMEFDTKKIAAAQEANNKLQYVLENNGDINASNIAVFESLIAKLDKAKNDDEAYKLIKETLNWSDKDLISLLNNLGETPAILELLRADNVKTMKLITFFENLKKEEEQKLSALTGGKSFEEVKKEADLLTKSAFGTNDLIKDVTQFNENMVMTETLTIAAGEIAGTVALSLVPGVGQAAMARLATSATSWGTKGVKVVKYAQSAQKAFETVNKVQSGAQFTSKVAKFGAKAGTAMSNTAVATAGVNLSAGKDLESSLKKALMNAGFAAAGVSANTLAPIIMKSAGITMEAAVQVAEEVLNIAGSYAITKVSGADYTKGDAFIDLIVGLTIAKLSGSKVDLPDNALKTADVTTKIEPETGILNKTKHMVYKNIGATPEKLMKKAASKEIQEEASEYLDLVLKNNTNDQPTVTPKHVENGKYYILPDGTVARQRPSLGPEYIFEIIDPEGNSGMLVASTDANKEKARKLLGLMQTAEPVQGDYNVAQKAFLEAKANQVKAIDLPTFEKELKCLDLDNPEVRTKALEIFDKEYPELKGVPGRIETLKKLQKLIESPEYLKLDAQQQKIAQLYLIKTNPRLDVKGFYSDIELSVANKRKIAIIESCLNDGAATNAAGIHRQEDFDTLIAIAKSQGVDEAVIKQMSESFSKAQANGCLLVNNTPIDLTKVPKQTVTKNGKNYNIPIIDLSNPDIYKTPELYGLPAGTTPENVRLTVHMNNDFNSNPRMAIGKMRQSEDLNLSATLTDGTNALYGNQQVGVGLTYEAGQVSYASNYSAGTGFGKDLKAHADARLNFGTSSNATFVRDRFIERMKAKNFDVTIEDYAKFSQEFLRKKMSVCDLDKLAVNGMLNFNGKKIPVDIVKTAISDSTDDMMRISYEMRGQTISNGMCEANIKDPNIEYIYVRANSPEETLESILSPQMLDYIEQHKFRVVFQGKEKL